MTLLRALKIPKGILLPVILVATLLVPPAAADQVSVRVSPHEGYGRIVFNWPVPVPYTANISGNNLIVRFQRPIENGISGLPGALRRYVRAARLSDGGRTVTIPLAGSFELRTFTLGRAVIVDLLDQQNASASPPPAQAPASTTAPRQQRSSTAPAGASARVAVRVGQHSAYSRLVFDWPSRVPYEVSQDNGKVTIRFQRPATIATGNIARGLTNVTGASAATDGSSTTVSLDVPPSSRLKHFLSGPKVVVDVLNPVPGAAPVTTAGSTPPPARQSTSTQSSSPALTSAPSPAQPQVVTAARPQSQVQATPQTPPQPQPTPAQPAATSNSGPISLQPPGSVASAPSPAPGQGSQQAALAPAPPAQPVPSVQREPLPEGEVRAASLRIDWTEPAAAAVFRRAGNIWLVFDRTQSIDTEALTAQGRGAVRSVEQIESRRGTFLKVEAPNGVNPTVRRDGLAWIFDFDRQPINAVTAISVNAQPNSPVGPRMFLPIAEAGEALALRDPEVGDNLIVVPVIPLGHGIAQRYQIPQMEILPTAQGVVLNPRADDLRVRSIQQGVEISSRSQLVLSSTAPKAQPAARLGNVEALTRVLRPDVWRKSRREGLDEFYNTKQDLMVSLSLAQGDQRQRARLDLATFYIASNFGYEALGVLDLFEKDNPDSERDPVFRFLKGAANFLVGRYDEADKNLSLSSLRDVDEAEFWRAAVQAGSGQMAEAAPVLADKGAVFRPYPRALKVPFGMLITEAAIALGDINLGSRYLEALAEETPTPREIDQLAYLEGQVKSLAGDFNGAVAAFEAVEKGEHRPSIAKATVARADLLLQLRKIKPEEAIEELESLRFSWRGDEFEFELLRRLGRLYLDIDDYRNGLRTLRQAASYFQDIPESTAVTEEMAGAFADLFLNDAADTMPPVRAIALYDEFKELTPAGESGDEMIRKLADRLAAVDLLDRAADLLTQQVEFRLEGEQKAEVGARLATIHLLNKIPEKAAEILLKSEVPGIPPALGEERRVLMARALVDQGQQSQALLQLEDDDTERADLLRSEIYWKSQDWPNAAKVLDRLVRASGAAPRKPLDEKQAQYVLNLAVAMTLSGNERGMGRLRSDYGAAMEGTPLKDAFKLIASPDSIGLIDYRTIASRVEQVSNFRKFMSTYREQLKSGALSEISKPPA